MSLTPDRIRSIRSDQQLYDALARELKRRVKAPDSLSAYVTAIAALPRGLRAMAGTYDLDVSITLDDLLFHFLNHPSRRLARITQAGLRELGAQEHAELFSRAFTLVRPHWSLVLRHPHKGVAGYAAFQRLQKRVDPLNDRLYDLFRQDKNILSFWVPYARAHPERVFNVARRARAAR